MNKWLNFGVDPDHRLAGIVFRIRHCLGDMESGINRLLCATLQCTACTSRHRHSNYDVTTSPAHDRQGDWYRDTGKTCLGGGMHCPNASSFFKRPPFAVNRIRYSLCRQWSIPEAKNEFDYNGHASANPHGYANIRAYCKWPRAVHSTTDTRVAVVSNSLKTLATFTRTPVRTAFRAYGP